MMTIVYNHLFKTWDVGSLSVKAPLQQRLGDSI